MEEDDEYLSARAKRFMLGSTLTRDACVSRMEIDYKHDVVSVKRYEKFYSKTGVALYYAFTFINLISIVFEWPGSVLQKGRELPYYIPLIMNFICEAYFYYRWYIIHSISVKEKDKRLASNVTLIILLLMTLDAVIYIICQEVPGAIPVRWSRALRPVLLLTFPENRRLRAAFFNLRSTAIDVLPVFGLFLGTLIFAAIVAITVIGNSSLYYPNGKPYFTDYPQVLWELYVLTTTANSPDVIVPAYESNRFFITFYIFVCTVCNWLFMGILTASVYNSYKAHLGEFVVNTVANRKKRLDEAFSLIATPELDDLPAISQASFLRLLRIVKPRRSEDSLRALFHILNKSRSGTLSINEFARLSEYLQVKLQEVELSREHFETYVPKFYDLYMSSHFQLFKRLVQHRVTKMFFVVMVIANGMTAIIGREYPSIQPVMEWYFTLIFLVELIINYIAVGGVHFFHERWNIFDSVVVLGALFGQIFQVCLEASGIVVPSGITQMLLLLRLLRLLKVFSAIANFKLVINCIITIMPSLGAYATMLIILFYIYSCFAMEVYGNRYEPPPQHNYSSNIRSCYHHELRNTDFVDWHYCIFNFNSISQSFIMMLVLTVGNNWQVFAEGTVLISTEWTRVFFLIVHWSCVLLVLNIVLAFIIEAFLIEYDSPSSSFELYIAERLEELGMNAQTELSKRGIKDFQKPGFYIDKQLLDLAFPPNSVASKAFFIKPDNPSVDVLMFRMFEGEVEELLKNYRASLRQQKFQTHDRWGAT